MPPSTRLPDFLIVGAQKAASTSLAAALRAHPDAWLPEQEDHHLHDPFFEAESPESFAARYADREEARVGLKCPDYLGRPEVPERARTILGEPDIIACLRNPVDRFVSAYYWYVRWSVIPMESLEVGAPKLLRGDYDHLPMAREVVEYGRYGAHLRRWREHFSEDRFLVLLQEEVRTDAQGALKQVLEFLSLRLDPPGGVSLPARANSGVYPMPRVRFLQAQTRLLSVWDPTGTYLTLQQPTSPLKKLVTKGVPAVDRYVLRRVVGNRQPRPSAGLRAQLTELYADDMADLEALLGKDLSTWRR